jgi:hypothetical protein
MGEALVLATIGRRFEETVINLRNLQQYQHGDTRFERRMPRGPKTG